MYDIGDSGGLYASFSANPGFQDPETEAFCYAVENQIKKAAVLAETLNVWTDLEHIRDRHMDYANACMRTPYYDAESDVQVKRDMLCHSMELRKMGGSVLAVETAISQAFSSAVLQKWYEYDGKPYHFKIKTEKKISKEETRRLYQLLKQVKAARSVVDSIEIERIKNKNTYYAMAGIRQQGHISIANREVVDRRTT